MNRLVNRRAAQVGNRPGVTKGQQWLKSTDKLELLDTPGILWPKFSSQEVANKLAFTGAIKESVYASDDVALFGLKEIRQLNPEGLKDRYHLNDDDLDLSDVDLLLQITKKKLVCATIMREAPTGLFKISVLVKLAGIPLTIPKW